MTAGRTVNTKSKEWGTPQKYVDAVKLFFGGSIDLDPCSNEYSIVKAKNEYMISYIDGLYAEWSYPTIYVNPPYGKDRDYGTSIKDWLNKCVETHNKYNSEILALIPVATNTMHWKVCVFQHASSIAFLHDTRLKFLINGVADGKGAPMACAMVYWGSRIDRFKEVFKEYGEVVKLKG